MFSKFPPVIWNKEILDISNGFRLIEKIEAVKRSMKNSLK